VKTPDGGKPNIPHPASRAVQATANLALPPILLALTLALLSILGVRASATEAKDAHIEWSRSDTDAFARARAEHRFVLLYLEAVWCHWCHVMDEKTYGDSAIQG